MPRAIVPDGKDSDASQANNRSSKAASARPAALTGTAVRWDQDRRRLVLVGLLVTAALVTVQALAQTLDFGVFDLRLPALNSDKHGSVFGIASLAAQLAVAAVALRRARLERDRRAAWLALGALVVGLVIVRGLLTYHAVLVAGPLACVLALVCWLSWRGPALAGAVVLGALAAMAVSLALHEVGLAADASKASDYTWAYQIEGMVKHGGELAGWLLLATGLLAVQESTGGRTGDR